MILLELINFKFFPSELHIIYNIKCSICDKNIEKCLQVEDLKDLVVECISCGTIVKQNLYTFLIEGVQVWGYPYKDLIQIEDKLEKFIR